MGFYAVIKGELVDGIAIADSPLETDGIWIDVTNVTPRPDRDWKYINGQFLPQKEPQPPITYRISKLSMISRFTNAEYVGILSASKTDVTVQAWYDAFNAATRIDLKDQRCIDGVNFLVSKNLLTQERATEILTTPAADSEIPQ